jgi:poly-gamma-glutamate synthesis protein (capsule biosynthesis protein)
VIILCLCAAVTTTRSVAADSSSVVRLIAFGDVNLGRGVGQKLLEGDTLFPFRDMKNFLAQGDIVFVNLESQLSDQNGETQDPLHNLIFTGPPAGGAALARAGVTIVSTANNHAYDYKMRALRETLRALDSSGIYHAGTSEDPASVYAPVLLNIKDIRFALFAITALMNTRSSEWRPYIAWTDTAQLLPRIRRIRDSVDVIIVSYHGGNEYVDEPTATVTEHFREITEAGADIIIGHHPHVFQGVKLVGQTWQAYSLGNFVFRQPQKFWTQKSVGLVWNFSRKDALVSVDSVEAVPVRTGFQPSLIDTTSQEGKDVLLRLHTLSNVSFPWFKNRGK